MIVDLSDASENMDEVIRNAVQIDADGLPTGRYPYSLEVTSNYPSSKLTTFVRDSVLIRNEQDSPFGVGWGIDGVGYAL